MKILKIIGIALLIIVVILGIVVAMQPAQGHIEKSTLINASPAQVYAQLNGFKSFSSWSPWSKMDPGATYTLEGPESGVGAKMNWDGPKLGKGAQWIVESEDGKRIKNGLKFDGFNGTPYAEFVLAAEGDGTKITWTYDGPNDGVAGHALWVVMKGALEGQYESGLADLKKYIESNPAPAAPAADTTTVAPVK